jgi:hypothetical protein
LLRAVSFEQVILVVAAIVLVLDMGLLAAALVRFRRARLVLG